MIRNVIRMKQHWRFLCSSPGKWKSKRIQKTMIWQIPGMHTGCMINTQMCCGIHTIARNGTTGIVNVGGLMNRVRSKSWLMKSVKIWKKKHLWNKTRKCRIRNWNGLHGQHQVKTKNRWSKNVSTLIRSRLPRIVSMLIQAIWTYKMALWTCGTANYCRTILTLWCRKSVFLNTM